MEERIEVEGRTEPEELTDERQTSQRKWMRTLLAEALNLMQTEGLTPDQAAARVGVSGSRRGKLVSLLETAQTVSKALRPEPRREAVEKTRRKLLDMGKRRKETKK